MTAGAQAILVEIIGPKVMRTPEIVALPAIRLQPPLPLTFPSEAMSMTVCRLSMTPWPRIDSASYLPLGSDASGLPDLTRSTWISVSSRPPVKIEWRIVVMNHNRPLTVIRA